MRTTITLEDDALELARRVARRRRITLGRAVSELVRRGARLPVLTGDRHGLKIIQLPGDSPRVTSGQIDALLEDLP